VGLERHGFDAEQRRILNTALRLLRQKQDREFAELAESHAEVADIRRFIMASKRGIARFAGR
jgi:acyl-[acyl carrier protein]--UDP-N-acetylglucosamine O-acyltransferase